MKVKGQTKGKSCCSGRVNTFPPKSIMIEYLYLDLNTCDRCIGTDNVLDDVIMSLTPALELAGYEVEYKKIEMETAAIAEQYQFLSSPTIRVNGRDICQSVVENSCGCCSEISGAKVDCRVFEFNGENYEVPPKEMLADAILYSVFGMSDGGCSCDTAYELPENLKEFFNGKKNVSSCCCDDDCS